MRPLPTERIIAEAPGRVGLVLTSHRVRLDVKKWGQVETVSIMLDELASCGVTGISYPGLLVAAPAALIIGLAVGVSSAQVLGVVGALALVAAYFLTRRRDLALTSAGDSIRIRTGRRMSVEAAASFIDSVEEAKDLRYIFRERAPFLSAPMPPTQR